MAFKLETYVAPVKKTVVRTPRVLKYDADLTAMGTVENNSAVVLVEKGDTLDKLRTRLRGAVQSWRKRSPENSKYNFQIKNAANSNGNITGIRIVKVLATKAEKEEAVEASTETAQVANN